MTFVSGAIFTVTLKTSKKNAESKQIHYSSYQKEICKKYNAMNPTWILKNIHENCKKMKLYKSLPIKKRLPKFDKKSTNRKRGPWKIQTTGHVIFYKKSLKLDNVLHTFSLKYRWRHHFLAENKTNKRFVLLGRSYKLFPWYLWKVIVKLQKINTILSVKSMWNYFLTKFFNEITFWLHPLSCNFYGRKIIAHYI